MTSKGFFGLPKTGGKGWMGSDLTISYVSSGLGLAPFTGAKGFFFGGRAQRYGTRGFTHFRWAPGVDDAHVTSFDLWFKNMLWFQLDLLIYCIWWNLLWFLKIEFTSVRLHQMNDRKFRTIFPTKAPKTPTKSRKPPLGMGFQYGSMKQTEKLTGWLDCVNSFHGFW